MSCRVFFSIFICSGLLFTSCGWIDKSHSDEDPVARVGKIYLYKTDIQDIAPTGVSETDSVNIVHAYIQNWVLQQLLVKKAKKNLSAKQQNFDRELDLYKNSLIIHAYQNMLVSQMVDTLVSIEETERYYEEHKENFMLKNNIVRVQFVKLNKNSKFQKEVEKLVFTHDLSGENLKKLVAICERDAVNYFLDSEKWLYFNEVLKEIPIETYDQEVFLKNHRTLKLVDDPYIYFINFKDFKIKDNISPFSFEKDRINAIILNKRKSDMIENLTTSVLKEAEEKKTYTIY